MKYLVTVKNEREAVDIKSHRELLAVIMNRFKINSPVIIWKTKTCAFVSDELSDLGDILSGRWMIGTVRKIRGKK